MVNIEKEMDELVVNKAISDRYDEPFDRNDALFQ